MCGYYVQIVHFCRGPGGKHTKIEVYRPAPYLLCSNFNWEGMRRRITFFVRSRYRCKTWTILERVQNQLPFLLELPLPPSPNPGPILCAVHTHPQHFFGFWKTMARRARESGVSSCTRSSNRITADLCLFVFRQEKGPRQCQGQGQWCVIASSLRYFVKSDNDSKFRLAVRRPFASGICFDLATIPLCSEIWKWAPQYC